MKNVSFFLLLVVLAFSFSVAGCGSSSDEPQTVALIQSDSGKTVSLHQNQTMTISLKGNASTGYGWEVVPGAESILTQQGNSQYVPDSTEPGMVGGGGTYTYTFKAAALGTASLQLIYRAPWMTGTPPAQTFAVTVVVGN